MKRQSRNLQKTLMTFLFFVFLFTGLCLQPEKELSAAPKTVRVGAFELNGFYKKTESGKPSGYAADYLDKIAEKTGWNYEYIWAENWDECVELLRQKKVDMIAPAQKTEARMKEFTFSSFSIGMECGTLLSLSTNEKLIYEDFNTFGKIKIGCVETLVFREPFIDYAASQGFTPSFTYYKDTKAVLAALNAGEIDAALTNIFAQTDTTKILAKFNAAPFYFMMQQDNPVLARQLNEALQQIKIEFVDFETKLMDTYYPSFNTIPFTKAELAYIEEAPILRVACRDKIQPLSYADEKSGEMLGITRQILDEISRISGLQFEYVPIPQGPVAYDFFQKNQISLISSVEYNEENLFAPGIHLTTPYLDSQKVFVCKKETPFDSNTKLRLAVATGSPTLVSAILKEYPQFEITVYQDVVECFEAVRKNQADALLQNQYVVAGYLAKPLYSHMITIPVEGFDDLLCLSPVLNVEKGVPDPLLSDERLISILNKSIRRISTDTLNKIIIKETTENQYRYTVGDFLFQYRYPVIFFALASLAFFSIISYTASLRHKSNRRIAENEAKLRHIANNINGGVVVLTMDDTLRITYANEGFLELLQFDKADYTQIQNQEYITYVHPDDVGILKELMSETITKENQISVKLRIMRKDGQFIPTLFSGTLTENIKGEREIYCVIMDNTVQENLLEQISLEQMKYSILIENTGDITFDADMEKRTFVLSPQFKKKFGWNIRSILLSDRYIYDILSLLKIQEEDWPIMETAMEQTFYEKKKAECQLRIQKSAGGYLWCQISLYPTVNANGELVNVIGRIADIDEEVRTRIHLEEKSRTDALTGLLNKEAFFLEAKKYLQANSSLNTAVIFIDLDNFKQINDNLGHMTGDFAIKETAKKLQIIFSNYDILARFGGDEFCVLLKEVSMETIEDKLAWTVEKLKNTYSENGIFVESSVSIGASYTKQNAEPLESLIEKADQALYKAKGNGKDQYSIYKDTL